MGIFNPILWIYCLAAGCVMWFLAAAIAAVAAYASTRIRPDAGLDTTSRVVLVFVASFVVAMAILFLVFLVVTRDVQLAA